MSKLLKVFMVGLTTLSMCAYGAIGMADVDIQRPVDIGALMPAVGSTTLDISLVGGDLSFDVAAVTIAAPWVRAAGYVRVQYSSTRNAAYVGVRIVSRNAEITETGDIAACVAPAMVDSDNDGANDDESYSGLLFRGDLDAGTAGEDPSKRAALAWQVFVDPPAGITVPRVAVGPDPILGGTVIRDESDVTRADSVGSWNAAWAYLGDVDDDNFVDTVWNVANPLDPNDDGPSYSIIVSGFTGPDGGYLAQHPRSNPAHDPRPADGDICVYLAGRFANTNWGIAAVPPPAPRAYVLPGGNYDARLYVEMIYDA